MSRLKPKNRLKDRIERCQIRINKCESLIDYYYTRDDLVWIKYSFYLIDFQSQLTRLIYLSDKYQRYCHWRRFRLFGQQLIHTSV